MNLLLKYPCSEDMTTYYIFDDGTYECGSEDGFADGSKSYWRLNDKGCFEYRHERNPPFAAMEHFECDELDGSYKIGKAIIDAIAERDLLK